MTPVLRFMLKRRNTLRRKAVTEGHATGEPIFGEFPPHAREKRKNEELKKLLTLFRTERF